MKFKLFKIKRNVAGFSLIEMIAVIFIVAVGLIGVSQLVVQSLQAQHISERTIVAHQLSQEGIELVRYIRDTNWLQGRDWRDGIADGPYCIDYKSPVLRSANDGCYLYLDSDGFYYSPEIADTPPDGTQYRRGILIGRSGHAEHYNNYLDVSLSVVSDVSWYEGGRRMNYKTVTDLFDWR